MGFCSLGISCIVPGTFTVPPVTCSCPGAPGLYTELAAFASHVQGLICKGRKGLMPKILVPAKGASREGFASQPSTASVGRAQPSCGLRRGQRLSQ